MQTYNDTDIRESCLTDSIKELQSVNKKLAKLNLLKEELTENIIGAIGHEHEGQKSYEYNMWKIEIKTPCVYSLNKKKYESGRFNLPNDFNPIRESIAYSIDKKMCDDIMSKAPQSILSNLVELIDKKPGKASVSIKERV